MNWTEEQDNILRALWGKHLARHVATTIGRSKNAVIGRARRIGLAAYAPLPVNRSQSPGRAYRPRPKLVKEPAPPPAPRPSLDISIFDLARTHCRFPTSGEGYKTLFCGHAVTDGNPYCGFHCSIAYEPPKPRKRYAWSPPRRRQSSRDYWRAA